MVFHIITGLDDQANPQIGEILFPLWLNLPTSQGSIRRLRWLLALPRLWYRAAHCGSPFLVWLLHNNEVEEERFSLIKDVPG